MDRMCWEDANPLVSTVALCTNGYEVLLNGMSGSVSVLASFVNVCRESTVEISIQCDCRDAKYYCADHGTVLYEQRYSTGSL
jgi:hypothetical protein